MQIQFPLTVLHKIAWRRPIKQIFFEDRPYIERYFLYESNRHVYYLHRMLGPDPDRDLHNHPWRNAYSRVLFGSYIERRLEFGFQKRKIQYIPANVINTVRGFYFYNAVSLHNTLGEYTWHSIVEIKEPETWTLFWHEKQWSRQWGFLTAEGFKPSKPPQLDAQDGDNKWWLDPQCKKGRDLMYGKVTHGSR